MSVLEGASAPRPMVATIERDGVSGWADEPLPATVFIPEKRGNGSGSNHRVA